MKIGKIEFKDKPVFLAPMEDVTDQSFRKICKKMGSDMVYTEFVSSEGLIRDAEKSLRKLHLDEGERPVGIQIFGHDIQSMVEAAKYAERFQPDLIDLNFGCPVKKVVRKGGGAGMLKQPDLMVEMTKAVVQSVDIPVTVKTRLGWDHTSIIIQELALRLQDVGIQALTLHARTRSQLYKGVSDWSYIQQLKADKNIEIPIIGNGDITTPQGALHAFEQYQPDAIMIGRAAIGNPWLFKSVKTYIEQGVLLEAPTLRERVEVCLTHLQENIQEKGERQSILEMRKLYSGYFKGVEHFKPFKLQLMNAKTLEEAKSIMENAIEELDG